LAGTSISSFYLGKDKFVQHNYGATQGPNPHPFDKGSFDLIFSQFNGKSGT